MEHPHILLIIREFHDLRNNPGEYRCLLSTINSPPRWGREAAEENRAIANGLEAKLNEWIERTYTENVNQ